MTKVATTQVRDLKYSVENKERIKTYMEMVRYRRPRNSKTELQFILRYILPTGAEPDTFNNYYLKIGDNPKTLWSAHTDTVHNMPGMQRVAIIADQVFLDPEFETISNCLGADNTSGVWMLLELIKAKIPGIYVFHREEESGLRGSTHSAKHEFSRFENIQFAVAFDRRENWSIITNQRGENSASKEFVASIQPMLPFGYKGDDTGIFTDTAAYMDIISECTNLSIGYYREHTKFEHQSLYTMLSLRDNIVSKYDETKLVAKRDPKAYKVVYPNYGINRYLNAPLESWDDGSYREYKEKDIGFDRNNTMSALVGKYHEEIADLLEGMGYDINSLWDEIAARHIPF